MGISCHSFKFLWRRVNSKLPTIPFGIVACTFSDNLSWNSCISKRIDTCPLTETLRFLLAILKPRHVNIFHTLNHRANTADLSWRVYVVLRAQSRSNCERPVYQIQSCKSSCRWEVLWEKSEVIICWVLLSTVGFCSFNFFAAFVYGIYTHMANSFFFLYQFSINPRVHFYLQAVNSVWDGNRDYPSPS